MIKNFFFKDIIKKIGIVQLFINWLEHRQNAKLQKQNESKTTKLNSIPKSDDANVAGLDVIGHDRYVSQLTKILGLNYGEKYANKNDLLKLHDEKLIIMTDQDQDGSHIKDLLINFIHYK
ncbi:unnamed protein product [Rotaria sordida]|uniref:DNA topoisomerase (ATP-hydrolyzing) n=1 Tax=Rotaria sordida TaxID=392033 RepID=A0A818N3D7_9BILA|nr:unnamed protein product [Rotaria sordida]CAF3599024.1 unnamed protein product [Rotaria sordida]